MCLTVICQDESIASNWLLQRDVTFVIGIAFIERGSISTEFYKHKALAVKMRETPSSYFSQSSV